MGADRLKDSESKTSELAFETRKSIGQRSIYRNGSPRTIVGVFCGVTQLQLTLAAHNVRRLSVSETSYRVAPFKVVLR